MILERIKTNKKGGISSIIKRLEYVYYILGYVFQKVWWVTIFRDK
jgi:hypothetical protein